MMKFQAGQTAVLTDSASRYPAAATIDRLADGGWIVTWRANDNGRDGDIMLQRFDARGREVGAQQDLGRIDSPAVAALPDGGWLVEGYDRTTDPAADRVFRYDSAGRQVDSAGTIEMGFEAIAGLAGNGWLGFRVVRAGFQEQTLLMQRHDAAGQPVGEAVTLEHSGVGGLKFTDIAMLADGGWVVTWSSRWQSVQQRFSADGTAAGPAEQLTGGTRVSDTNPQTSTLADGGWITLFLAEMKIQMLRFDSTGQRVGDVVTMPLDQDISREGWTITGLANGGWALAWSEQDRTKPFDGISLRVQAYDESGRPVGRSYEIDDSFAYSPFIEPLDNGGFVVSWATSPRGDGNMQINQRVFQPVESNTVPHAVKDVGSIFEGRKIRVDVLDNDRDADKDDILSLESASVVSGNGTVEVSADGTLMIRHLDTDMIEGQSTKLVIEYTISDGFDIDTGRVVVTVKGFTDDGEVERGTAGNDRYNGSNRIDNIYYGLGGRDIISGGGGDDILFGGSGNDAINGKVGDDIIVGGRGDDYLVGSSGSDTYIFRPGDGKDRIEQSNWSIGARDTIDLTAFNFDSAAELRALITLYPRNFVIDLPGRDEILVIRGREYPLHFEI